MVEYSAFRIKSVCWITRGGSGGSYWTRWWYWEDIVRSGFSVSDTFATIMELRHTATHETLKCNGRSQRINLMLHQFTVANEFIILQKLNRVIWRWIVQGRVKYLCLCSSPHGLLLTSCTQKYVLQLYRVDDKSLARPSSQCISFDGENISFDASLVIYINSTNFSPIIIINRIYEHQNILSL